MANPSTAHEPSMEEILASIRQIISEDGEGASVSGAEAEAPSLAPSPAPVPLGQPDRRANNAQSTGDPMPAQPLEAFARTPAPAVPPSSGREPARRTDAPQDSAAARTPSPVRANGGAEDRPLLSETSDLAIAKAINALAHTVLAQNAHTLEDVVVDLMRPMMREWLDDNLPALVERLVQEEIHRVSRGRR